MLTDADSDRTVRPGARHHVVALAIVLAAFAVFAVLVAMGAGGGLDARVTEVVIARRRPALDTFFVRFTGLGSWYVVTPVAAALAVAFAAARRWRAAALLVVAPLWALVLNVVLKLVVHRTPPGGDDDGLVAHARYSFPSGHTMTTTALLAALTLVAWPTRWRWPVTAGTAVVAATMGVSRVYVGVHHPSDVVAGWMMGAATAWLVWLALRPRGLSAAPGGDRDAARPLRVVLFDWGDTLMVDDGRPGRMADWPQVAAVPGAAEALAALYGRYRLCVATNAEQSGADEVMAALGRVELARFIDRVFSSRDLGARKPDPAFYAAVLEGLRRDDAAVAATSPGAVHDEGGLRPDQVVMVGDTYENDVAGALAAGLRAIWFHPAPLGDPALLSAARPARGHPPDGVIRSLSELPDLVCSLDR